MGHGLGFGLGIPGLGMIIFWGLVIVLLVWVIRGVSGGRSERMNTTAKEILDQRYARGAIGRDEYQERKQLLE